MISTRHLQAMAAVAIEESCKQKEIFHADISSLVDHLLSVLTAELLSDWEQQGIQLPYGSGDEAPDEIRTDSDPKTSIQLQDIVNNGTEVGLVDMYGADTRQPMYFLTQTLSLVSSSGVKIPSFYQLVDACHAGDGTICGWGEPLSQSEADAIVRCYREAFRRTRHPPSAMPPSAGFS